jgi:hypothetical protein
MKSTYLDTPQAALALNFKVGSASLARAVIAAHHPELNAKLSDGTSVHYPAGKSAENTRWHGLCPKVNPSERPVVLLPVRDPIEKFRSACAESNVSDVDAKLTTLEAYQEADWGKDVHFWPQSRLLFGTTKLYAFPDHLNTLATDAGLSLPLPDIDGEHGRSKPDLTSEQVARVSVIYADDIALFESITEAGKVHTTPEPPPEPLPVPESITAWQAQAALKLTPLGDGTLYDAVVAALAALPDGPEKVVAQTAFEKDAKFVRSSPTIAAIASALGLTSEQVDDLFRLGDSLIV